MGPAGMSSSPGPEPSRWPSSELLTPGPSSRPQGFTKMTTGSYNRNVSKYDFKSSGQKGENGEWHIGGGRSKSRSGPGGVNPAASEAGGTGG